MNDASAPQGRTESAIAFLRELIAAQVKGEAAVQAAIAARLAQAGCTVAQTEYDPAKVPVKGEIDAANGTTGLRSAVVGTLEGQGDLPSLLIFAHPDGEPVTDADQWTHDAFAGEIDGGRLYGWGVADDLAGCAAAVLAVEAAAASGQPMGRVVFASTPSKRYARGVAALLHDGLRADAALYLHPAESGVGMREIKALASGHVEFKITIKGQAPDTTEPGQTAFSHLAANPVNKAFLIHAALMDLAEARAKRVRQPQMEARVGRATNLHISRLQCGEMRKFSRIHDECIMGGALSFPPGETLAEICAEVEAAVAKAAQSDDWLRDNPPRVDWLTGVTGAHVPEDHPLYQVTARAVSEVTGEAPYVNVMHTSSDIRNPPVEADIPCVAFGCLCGDLSQNEKRDEWIDVADFQRMVDVTTQVVTDWCRGRHP
ncbi:M20 family metallopeptidase [Marinovum sp.]|uniref:M20 family metallopeptidase n=1 Tax=Marinovum sp. TaxID=2024839 RepID=UPI002B277EB8|nr:M20/M25/M40 family metallo-hydrolase [Marinovum sp.]